MTECPRSRRRRQLEAAAAAVDSDVEADHDPTAGAHVSSAVHLVGGLGSPTGVLD